MTIIELIAGLKPEEITFQNLDRDAISLDFNAKTGAKITFATGERFTLKGTERLGLVLWLPRDKVAEIIPQSAALPDPSVAPSAEGE